MILYRILLQPGIYMNRFWWWFRWFFTKIFLCFVYSNIVDYKRSKLFKSCNLIQLMEKRNLLIFKFKKYEFSVLYKYMNNLIYTGRNSAVIFTIFWIKNRDNSGCNIVEITAKIEYIISQMVNSTTNIKNIYN